MPIYSVQVERHVLGGLIRNSEVFFDVARFISEKDFYNDVHSTIFSCIKDELNKNNKIDKVLLAQKIKNLGISFKDEIDIFSYIDTLAMTQINTQGTMNACKELSKLKVRRELFETAENVKKYVKDSAEDGIDSIVSKVDEIYNNKVTQYYIEGEPVNLFEEMESIIEEIGNNPREETGLKTPYNNFNNMYGGLKNGNIYSIVSRPGQGKALEENTPILTPNGFVKIKNLKIGDEVFSIDGKPTKILGIRKWNNRKLYKVSTDDNQYVLADENHEWTVKTRSECAWKVLTTKYLFENKKSKRPKIPNFHPLELNKQRLIIDPYILGIWLGDGHSSSAAITSIDKFIINKWQAFGKTLGLNFYKFNKYSYRLSSNYRKNIFTTYLKHLNVLGDKHIPAIYLNGSIDQRRSLLQGLMDSDGYIAPDGQAEFCSTNKKLAENTLELIHSLGVKASMYESNAYLYGKYCGKKYRIRFYYKHAAKLPRKAKKCKNSKKYNHRYLSIEKYGTGNTVCIQVDHPSHLFLAGKGLIVTHNSTWLNDICYKTANACNKNTKAIILDTEMSTLDTQMRLVASISTVPLWYIETGNWRKNPEMIQKIRDAWPKVKNMTHYHYHVANKNIDEIASIIRRWYYTKVGRGNQAIIAYDYIKLTGEKVGQNWAEHQAIGDKIDKLKRISEEIKCPVITAMQLNRTGENFNRNASQVTDDSSAISLSDRMQWFASFVGIFRRKTQDEIQVDGEQFGTHKLIAIKTRFQGREGTGHHDLVRRRTGENEFKYFNNYINFDVGNFNVEERGTLREIVDAENERLDFDQGSNDQDGELI